MIKRTYKRKSKSDGSDAGMKTPKSENLVTGVSRSGRVRKKSSKLIDYESGAEELERPKRKSESANNNVTPRTPLFRKQPEEYEMDYSTNEVTLSSSVGNQQTSESEPETNIYPTNDGFDDSSADTSGTELEEDLEDKLNIVEEPTLTLPETSYSHSSTTSGPSTSQKSLYMLEKFAKKRKNGKTVKAGRKDKGKARFSAYMLWAREVRPDLMKSHPNIDFSQLSSKLGDLWATVPYTDKYMWKQKAKRMAMLAKNSNNREEANLQKAQIKTTLQKKYMNKKLISPQRGRPPASHKLKTSPLLTEISNPVHSSAISSAENKSNSVDVSTKSISTEPLDVAAHLKLLGESLSIIGQRLKEHEGQIAVSGSLSVLLDTLLCSLGPLLCLTQQVEEMNGCSKETLNSILDNIAYIMPGL